MRLKSLRFLVAIVFMLALLPPLAYADPVPSTCSTPLIAGQHYNVGVVNVWKEDGWLKVQFVATAGCITETHVDVQLSEKDFPQTKKGNPKIGHFAYSRTHDPCVIEHTEIIPLTYIPGYAEGTTTLFVAAHAVVEAIVGCAPDLQELEKSLPETVSFSIIHPGTSVRPYSYLDVAITDSELVGTYSGYCVNTSRYISQDTTYKARVYSSYGSVPDGLVDKPWNLDLVNYLINQEYVGQEYVGGVLECSGDYTYGDVQLAIWTLLDDTPITATIGDYAECRVQEILRDVSANGEGFIPGCGACEDPEDNDLVVLLLDPVDGEQPILISIPVECEPLDSEETAWGNGTPFTDSTWAMYFSCPQPDSVYGVGSSDESDQPEPKPGRGKGRDK